jgi:CBS domain-containing protein
MGLMVGRHIRHLPVVENGKLIGIISMRDAMAAALEQGGGEVKGLDTYSPATGFQG